MNDGEVLIISLHADPSVPSGVGEGGGTHAYLRELAAGLAIRRRPCSIVTRRMRTTLDHCVSISPLTTLFRIDIGPPGQIDKKYLNNYHRQAKRAIRKVINNMECQPQILHSVYWNSGRAAMDLSTELGIC